MTENSKIDWTKAVDPRLQVMWIADYLIAWDAVIALPVSHDSPAALKAIERGLVKEVSHDEAQLINDRFVGADRFGESSFVEKKIASRWDQMIGQSVVDRITHAMLTVNPFIGVLFDGDIVDDVKIGSTLRIRLPADFVASGGPGLLQNISMREIRVYSPGEAAAAGDVVLQPFSKEAEQERIWNLLTLACK